MLLVWMRLVVLMLMMSAHDYDDDGDDNNDDVDDYDDDDADDDVDDDTDHDTVDDTNDDTDYDTNDDTDDDTDDGGRGNRRPLPRGAVHVSPPRAGCGFCFGSSMLTC